MERSGTDAQIVARIRRGHTSTRIADELGCSFGRIARLAKAHGIDRKRTGGAIAQLEGVRTGIVTREARRVTPWQRVPVPPGWTLTDIDYTDVDDDVIILRRKKT